MQSYSKLITILVLAGIISLCSCHSSHQLATVKGSKIAITSDSTNKPNENIVSIVAPYKAKVDSIMLPVIGRSSKGMEVKRPESLLSNLISDILRESAATYIGHPADLAVMNMGGIRSSLNEGNILYQDAFEILPFENSLCIVYLKGNVLKELMQNIVNVGGEGVSNVQLKATKEKEIIGVNVGGKPIDDNRIYTVATVDYLAEGNDRMLAFRKAEKKESFDKATLRQLFLDYVSSLTAQGKELTSNMEGRITFE